MSLFASFQYCCSQDFYEGILKVLGDDDENEQVKLKQGLSELPEIYELHQDILEELEERVLKWQVQNGIV